MHLFRVDGWQPAAAALAKRLQKELGSGKHVLWLVTGGSNIEASVAVMTELYDADTERLTVLLADERYGAPGHKDANYTQFQHAGFNHKQATFMPVLVEGLTMEETAHRYAELLGRAMDYADAIIGQIGIGPDGHIAGILPNSPAANAGGLVTSYEAPPYQRVTMTFKALRRIDADYTLAFGVNKRLALHKLEAETLGLAEQPAQLLKELPEVYIYNDQIGQAL